MKKPDHVALIGCGFTGTSAFFQMVDRFPVSEITIFEATGEFGPGYPYRPDECRDYLLNNGSDTMRLVPGNPRGFVEWLRHRPDLAPDLDEKGHEPRAHFGAFLKDAFNAAMTAAAVKGVRVRLVPFEATSLSEREEGGVRVGWLEEGVERSINADVAILTTGRCPDVDPFPHPPEGSKARYIPNHVMTDAFDDLPLDAHVHVLGASLSAYDVVNRLFSPDTGCRFRRDEGGALVFEPGPNARHVTLVSRSGRLKHVRPAEAARFERRRFTLERMREAAASGGVSLETVKQWIDAEAAEQGAKVDWAAVLDPYSGCEDVAAVTGRALELLERSVAVAGSVEENFLVELFIAAEADIWKGFAAGALTAAEEKRYRDDVESALLTYGAPCPSTTAERLLALLRAGRMRVIRGVKEERLTEDGSAYEIEHEVGVETASVVVSCIGAVDRDVESEDQPSLVRDLVRQGLLRPYERGGIRMSGADVDMESYRARGARDIYVANMLLWGPGFFTSSAFLMSRVAERVLEEVFVEAR